jgi:hypothetical protein
MSSSGGKERERKRREENILYIFLYNIFHGGREKNEAKLFFPLCQLLLFKSKKTVYPFFLLSR